MIKYLFLVTEINEELIYREYIAPFNINPKEVHLTKILLDKGKKKVTAKTINLFLTEILPDILKQYNPKYLVITNPEYFKSMAKVKKVEPKLGYILDYDSRKLVYVPNYKQVFYDRDKIRSKIALGLSSLIQYEKGVYEEPGTNIISRSYYPRSIDSIKEALQNLLVKNKPLTCDIEAYSLKHYNAGLGSITFCWNEHEGISFRIDPNKDVKNEPVRQLLKDFFYKFNNTLIFHNIAYDATVLIYQLFMTDINDRKGLLEGLKVILKNWEDTKLIAYLATNTCAGNDLKLKSLAQQFAGDYAEDNIKNIDLIPEDELLKYNLIDGLSTWFVYNKYYPKMVKDDQLKIYTEIFKPSTVDIIHMQLVGMPLNMKQVNKVNNILKQDYNNALNKILKSPYIKQFEHILNVEWVEKKNKTLKKIKKTLKDAHETFNPNSPSQLQKLLYEFLKLPILGYTPTGQPTTDGDTIKALTFHTTDKDKLTILEGLEEYKAVDKILTAFMPAFLGAIPGNDGRHYLFGNFNLGGTVSGRLSSSDINLQNLPATGSKYAKVIKSCFQAPEGWLMVGLDFDALEDHISALTTKDPNKLKVYIENYDGHCLRAYSYFKDKMPDITQEIEKHPEQEVHIINSIKQKHGTLRQNSKAPTFALTYQGTWRTLVKKCGFSEEDAKHIEKQYHELYKVSDEWVQKKLDKACINGYITGAFGLKIRTPMLKQVIRGNSKTPKEAEAEGRTAGNALGQSWCLLNNRAGNEFNALVRSSEYKYNICPIAQIHDAQYFLIKDNLDTLMYLNKHLCEAVQWQNHPDIAHDKVHLSGKTSVFFPDWAHELVVPNNITATDLYDLVKQYVEKLCQKMKTK